MGRPKIIKTQGVELGFARDDFMEYLRKTCKLADSTLRNKGMTLEAMTRTLGAKTKTDALTGGLLERVITDLSGGLSEEENRRRAFRGLSPRTGRQPRSLDNDRYTLGQFIRYCQRQGWAGLIDRTGNILEVPKLITESTKPKGGNEVNHDPPVLAAEEWPEVLELAGRRHPRTRMAFAIGFFWARRISETSLARYGDINWTAREAKLYNKKRGRDQYVPLEDGMIHELNLWKEWVTSTYGVPQPHWFLVPRREHARVFTGDVPRRKAIMADTRLWPVAMGDQAEEQHILGDIQKVLLDYGWKDIKQCGGHTLRRSCLIEVEERAGLPAAQELAGHQDIRTTQGYTRNTTGRKALGRKLTGDFFGVLGQRQADIIHFRRKAE